MNTWSRSVAVGLAISFGTAAAAQWEDRTLVDHPSGTSTPVPEVCAADPVHGGAIALAQGSSVAWDGRVVRVEGLGYSYSVPLGAAYDPTTGVLIVDYGDPAGWTSIINGTIPGLNRTGAGLAFDLVSGAFLSVGGVVRGPAPSGNTFLLQMSYWSPSWVQVVTSPQPPLRLGPQLATDLGRRRIVLFGGRDPSGMAFGDTWEWNGTRWTPMPTALPPQARWAGGIAYDPLRRVTVLHGGTDGTDEFADTWEWQGSRWMRRASSAKPWRGHHLFFDPQHAMVMAWRGGTLPGFRPMMAWDGVAWSELDDSPWPRLVAAVCNDTARGRLVVFGGVKDGVVSDETWEWDGMQWYQRQPPRRPPARMRAAMGFDPVRQRTVLCGGMLNDYPYYTRHYDTWEWDGNTWTQVSGGVGGFDLQFAWHPASNGLLLWDDAGGLYGASTWLYDAAGWHQVMSIATTPQAKGARMAARPSTGEVLLYGSEYPNNHASMWSFQGTWVLIDPVCSPGPLVEPAFVEDPATGRMLLIGGSHQSDTYEWNGTSWQITGAAAPFLQGTGAIDPMRNTPVAINGGMHELMRVAASNAPLYGGCPGSRGALAHGSLDRFLVGRSNAGLGVTNALPFTPVAFAVAPGYPTYQSIAGCTVVRAPVWLGLRTANAAGAAEVTIPVPNRTQLLGLHIATQAIAFDPAAPSGTFAASPAMEVILGG
ncbi:MAG: kelch repeat-containing protein [Planctomycetota bacterium]